MEIKVKSLESVPEKSVQEVEEKLLLQKLLKINL